MDDRGVGVGEGAGRHPGVTILSILHLLLGGFMVFGRWLGTAQSCGLSRRKTPMLARWVPVTSERITE